ncbi:hypothetical protein K461DRAFT_263663 [Myriangium duriaei CBS 260.36]|uniref:Uncharacterized protein n=1 Tax=Myriangium duriaei CBS 260.36 TaxID=1168546 RepID=A0A9P4JAW0_9PEZI|nr:hypothetical protein K461DRAFT_263663 [Myriangium duriaei CBS 260.36]
MAAYATDISASIDSLDEKCLPMKSVNISSFAPRRRIKESGLAGSGCSSLSRIQALRFAAGQISSRSARQSALRCIDASHITAQRRPPHHNEEKHRACAYLDRHSSLTASPKPRAQTAATGMERTFDAPLRTSTARAPPPGSRTPRARKAMQKGQQRQDEPHARVEDTGHRSPVYLLPGRQMLRGIRNVRS